MTKRLPPHDPTATDDDVSAAVDDDALVRLREVDRAEYRGPVGLGFAIGFNVEPTTRAFELFADILERVATDEPKKLPAKRKPRKRKPKA